MDPHFVEKMNPTLGYDAAIEIDEPSALLNAFATYLRRMVGSTQASRAVVVTDDAKALSAETIVGVVAARRPTARVSRHIRRRAGLVRQFSGSSSLGTDPPRPLPVEIYDRWDRGQVSPRPSSFDVLAIIPTFNEEDIIGELISRLLSQGVRIHVIDNWSTDTTAAIISELSEEGYLSLERFPPEGSTGIFEWERICERVEEVAHSSGASWAILHGADEIRESPWKDVNLSNALWMVEQWGYNCVDHSVVNFRPVDDLWRPGDNLADSFEWCEFGTKPSSFSQLTAWKPQPTRVRIADLGGHQATFDGRSVFPYKFLNRHYPIRSQSHAERKILRERQPRWNPAEREKGWHVQYDHYGVNSSFIWDPDSLFRWDEMDHLFFLQRLSGVGLLDNPWPGEGLTAP
jgi:glycosyltransferase involved in cell wall biosynthesis